MEKFKNLVYSIYRNSFCHHICSKSSLLPILSKSCLFIGTSKVLPYSWRYPPPSLAERIPGTIFHEDAGICLQRGGSDQTPTKRIQKTKSNVAIGFILKATKGAAWHRGSVRVSHPKALGSNRSKPNFQMSTTAYYNQGVPSELWMVQLTLNLLERALKITKNNYISVIKRPTSHFI